MEQSDASIYGRKAKRIFESRMKPFRDKYDLKMIEIEILLFFYENKEKTASDLNRALDLNKGQVSTGINNLCERNLLVAHINPEDRRTLRYELVEESVHIIEEVRQEVLRISATMMQGLTPEQQQQFCDLCRMICDNIDKYFED